MKFASVILLVVGTLAVAQEIQTVQVASGVSSPTDIQNAGDGTGRLFFVQQNGIILVFRNGAILPTPFLDIRTKTVADGERGMLGLAFPPGFAQKQRFYVDYTDTNGDTVIAQYRVSSNPDVADSATETVLLHIAQPFANHNGGQVRFGPDGYLYIGMGDGGGAGDPTGNGQNLGTLLGKLLRIDVESSPGSVVIPPDNPFVNTSGARPEIWAWGLRNPWRFSFDSITHDLWIADVGQNQYEEVDFQPSSSHGGENYGWNRMEGNHCYQANCSTAGLVLPVAEYSHAFGCSISGGFVYRGSVSPGLRGTYIYGDYCSGYIWGVTGNNSRLLLSSGFGITTFGLDEAGEIYVANAANGTIHHVVGSAAPTFTAAGVVNAASLAPGLSPGSLATVFAAGVKSQTGITSAAQVPLPTTLGNVSVQVNGVDAPILAVADVNGQEQVNFQAPFEIAGLSNASLTLTYSGQRSAPATVQVSPEQPGIYSADGSHAVIIHAADYSLVTAAKPLTPGEYAFLYAAGLGPVMNPPQTGGAGPISPLASTVSPATVKLAGALCDVQYAGLAPGLVGVYQVNFRVPASPSPGGQDVVLGINGLDSPALQLPQ